MVVESHPVTILVPVDVSVVGTGILPTGQEQVEVPVVRHTALQLAVAVSYCKPGVHAEMLCVVREGAVMEVVAAVTVLVVVDAPVGGAKGQVVGRTYPIVTR